MDLHSQQPTVERLQRLKVIRNRTDVEVQKPCLVIHFGLKPTEKKHVFLMLSNIQLLSEGITFCKQISGLIEVCDAQSTYEIYTTTTFALSSPQRQLLF